MFDLKRLLLILLAAGLLPLGPVTSVPSALAEGGVDISGGEPAPAPEPEPDPFPGDFDEYLFGEGEDTVVCFANPATAERVRAMGGRISAEALQDIVSIEALDLYEARLKRGMNGEIEPEIIPVLEGEGPREYVTRILDRFRYAVPQLADAIEGVAAGFADIRSARFDSHGQDSNVVGLIDPEHCLLATGARTLIEMPRHDKVLEFNRDLLVHSRQSALSRAVLLLHEYILQVARDMGHQTARRTRLLTGLLITANNGLTMHQLIEAVQVLGFSPERPFLSYSSYLSGPVIRRVLEAARDDFNRYDSEVRELVAEVHGHLELIGFGCAGNRIIACKSAIETAKHRRAGDPAELDALRDRLITLGERRARSVHAAMNAVWGGDEGRKTIADAPGMDERTMAFLDRYFEQDFIYQIAMLYTDLNSVGGETPPVDVLDIESMVHGLQNEIMRRTPGFTLSDGRAER